MSKQKRNALDKLNTLFFGKDLRVTEGDPYTEVREFDFTSYFPVENYIYKQNEPSENVFDIRSFGADTENDDNAPFINKAVEAAGECGGTVLIKGGNFVTTTVTLKSNVTLFICPDSSLTANESGKGYEHHRAIIYGNECENITLTGGGTVKGNGHLFGRKPVLDKNLTSAAEYIDVIEMRKSYRSQLRFAHESKYGGIVSLVSCKNVRVDNFIIENSAYWTFKILNCNNVSISNLVINNNRNVANADGIDIAGSSNVCVNKCFVSTADDGIVIKNAIWLGNKGSMKNITVTDCEIISRTNAVKVGTETTYDISDIKINNCSLLMTDLYPGSVSGISLEACDGSVLSNIDIEKIKMNRCTCPIFIRLGNRNRASRVNTQSANAIEFGIPAEKGGETGRKIFDGHSEVRDIRISNIKADEAEIPIIIAGYRQMGRVKRVKNVVLENVTVNYANLPETVDRRLFIPEYAEEYPECWRFRNLPSYALWIRHAENITLRNFVCNHPHPTWKKAVFEEDKI